MNRIDFRLRKLEERAADAAGRPRPLDIIGRVEAIVRASLGAYGDPRFEEDPETTAAISQAVRAVVEVIETQGPRAGQRWADALKAQLLPGHPGVIVRGLQAHVERAAFARGDLAGVRQYPE